MVLTDENAGALEAILNPPGMTHCTSYKTTRQEMGIISKGKRNHNLYSVVVKMQERTNVFSNILR